MVNKFITELRDGDIGITIDTKYQYDIVAGHLNNHKVVVGAMWGLACQDYATNFRINDENQLSLDYTGIATEIITADEFCTRLNAAND